MKAIKIGKTQNNYQDLLTNIFNNEHKGYRGIEFFFFFLGKPRGIEFYCTNLIPSDSECR